MPGETIVWKGRRIEGVARVLSRPKSCGGSSKKPLSRCKYPEPVYGINLD